MISHLAEAHGPGMRRKIQADTGTLTDHVDHFRTSDQKQRSVGMALIEIEPRLRRAQVMNHLPALGDAIQEEHGIEGHWVVA